MQIEHCHSIIQKQARIISVLLFKVAALFFAQFLLSLSPVSAQTPVVDRKNFFAEERPVEMTIITDLKKLINEKEKKDYEKNIQPATITFLLPDSIRVQEEAEIRPRGEFRREECYIPPIMINFKTPGSAAFKKLGRLKFVWPCDNSIYYEQLVLREYLVYKIFNLLTEKSFRVRLVKLEYHDSNRKIKGDKAYGFFIEDVDDMARRNNCVEVDKEVFYSELTNRRQATLIALFQYMIGNTDWAVSVYHNIKLIRSNKDSLSQPFMVPYDFDCNGLVNADYAIPPPELPISSVRERLYRGFPRTMEELEQALEILINNKKAIDSLIMNCKPLLKAHKKEMLDYVDEFYTLIKEKSNVREIFIEKARKE